MFKITLSNHGLDIIKSHSSSVILALVTAKVSTSLFAYFDSNNSFNKPYGFKSIIFKYIDSLKKGLFNINFNCSYVLLQLLNKITKFSESINV